MEDPVDIHNSKVILEAAYKLKKSKGASLITEYNSCILTANADN